MDAAPNTNDVTGDDLLASVCLQLAPGIGPRIRCLLVDRFGSPVNVLRASPAQLSQVDGVGPALVRAIVNARRNSVAAQELERCRQMRIELTPLESARFPRLLREIADPPGVLYVQGELQPADALAVAIVGTRRPTRYGLRQAELLAAGLARSGMTVVSGLARGIDAAAHRAAMKAGGRTIAVLAGGLASIYPPEHKKLAREITSQGAIVSENSLTSAPRRGQFPRRNRLISGMVPGVVVVEAALASGALVTARHAVEQNRDVFAVPGCVDSGCSRGCHRLIRDGAKLIESIDDVIDELGPLSQSVSTRDGFRLRIPSELKLNDQERAVLSAIDIEPTRVDQIVERSQLTVPRVLATLSVLEMRHLIRRISGDRVARAYS